MKKILIFSFLITIVISLIILIPVLNAASPIKRLTWNTSSSTDPFIAVDSNDTIHVVWQNSFGSSIPTNMEICYKRSTDGGNSWSPLNRLTYMASVSRVPILAVDSQDNLHLVWWDYLPGPSSVYYKNSTDGGITWSSAKRLTWQSDDVTDVYIATAANNRLHVVWEHGTKYYQEVYYKKSSDGGATWQALKRMTWTSGQSMKPRIVVDSNNAVYVVWVKEISEIGEIYFKKSTNAGGIWTAPKRLTYNSGYSSSPVIGITGNDDLHIIWEDFTPGNADIFYKKSTNKGVNWLPLKRLTWNSSGSRNPFVIGDLNSVRILYMDYLPGTFQLYFKQSNDNGTNWGSIVRLTWRSTSCNLGNFAVDSNGLNHIVWDDFTAGNSEIYYKQY